MSYKTKAQAQLLRSDSSKSVLGYTRPEWSWAFYDWANSSFATTVMAGFFQIFFKQYWSGNEDPTLTTARLGVTISAAGAAIALFSPFLGVLTDLTRFKKRFLFIAALIGSLSCCALALLGQGEWYWAMMLYGLGIICFTGSGNFYDSLLPSVAGPGRVDRVSLLGYSMGYLGGGLLFLLNVLMFLNPHWFGIADGITAVKISFVSVGLWWLIFTMPLMFNVHEYHSQTRNYQQSFWTVIGLSFRGLAQTVKDIWAIKPLRYFLIAYWLYIDGVFTVITMAVDYGLSLGLESKDLISALLITQFVGFPATLAYAKLIKRGPKMPLLFCIGVYMLAVILATQMRTGAHFMLLAMTIGLVQGGVQSLSRSYFVQMIPAERSGEFFGFFNLVGKFASIIGPLVVGATVYLTGNAKMGMLGLLLLFFLGAMLLLQSQPRVG